MCGDDDGIDGVGIRIAGGKGACEGPAPRPAVRWEQGRGGVSCATHSGLRPVSTSIWASMAGGHRVSRGWCRRGRAAPCCGIRQQRRAELARIQISHSLSVERPRGSHSSSRQKQERAHITATCPTPHATRHTPHPICAKHLVLALAAAAAATAAGAPHEGARRGGTRTRAPWRHARAYFARRAPPRTDNSLQHSPALSPAGTHSLPLAQSKGKVFLKTRKRAHHASRGPAARRG